MQNQKYNLVDATEEEKKSFMEAFNALLEEKSLYFEPVPIYNRDTLESPWKLTCQVMLMKKELIKEDTIPTPFAKDESTETA